MKTPETIFYNLNSWVWVAVNCSDDFLTDIRDFKINWN
ncbi:hypothetical protein SAMN05444362_101611 [Dysgonomonas macrotermitis]|uniref:Uncharacterized protein n=1 Tax=Dysgonomonas macrotermitis TaxID=1346286 RepID=A0A1M4UIA0_9BACT|nr:hypothetical protein SAMN05444362_101611 [Dysgonomonas macrotermitis]